MRRFLTKEGKKKIQDELNFLLTIEKDRVISDLADARECGQLEENTQYLVAKDEYEKLQSKIESLQAVLLNSSIVDTNNLNNDSVMILSKVKVLNINNNREMIFNIVPENEIDLKSLKISPKSPIGSTLMGKKVNDICMVNTPSGKFEYKIIEISI